FCLAPAAAQASIIYRLLVVEIALDVKSYRIGVSATLRFLRRNFRVFLAVAPSLGAVPCPLLARRAPWIAVVAVTAVDARAVLQRRRIGTHAFARGGIRWHREANT